MFSNALNSLISAIEIYTDNPCPATKIQLKDRLRNLSVAYQQDQKEMEKRIVKEVLSQISISADTQNTVAEIKAVDKALTDFERRH